MTMTFSDSASKEQFIIPNKPIMPDDSECCQSECGEACVFELYRQDKLDYDAKIAQLKALGVVVDE